MYQSQGAKPTFINPTIPINISLSGVNNPQNVIPLMKPEIKKKNVENIFGEFDDFQEAKVEEKQVDINRK